MPRSDPHNSCNNPLLKSLPPSNTLLTAKCRESAVLIAAVIAAATGGARPRLLRAPPQGILRDAQHPGSRQS
jgi:hypothetical protein